MARKKLKPVSIWGIEFDALIDETKNLSATIPTYPVEEGYDYPGTDQRTDDSVYQQYAGYMAVPAWKFYRPGK